MSDITLEHVSKKFGTFSAVDDVSLTLADGDYTTILGPSGCGKTTLLRLIAGIIQPTHGNILIDGKQVVSIFPEDRAIGYLFQNYALFPHMNVSENVEYGPLMQGKDIRFSRNVSDDMLKLVHLLSWGGFLPHELSGGMQQRVALSRALAAGYNTLFLDEPMSSLDPKIGMTLRYEIQKIAKRLKLTVLHVTHNQVEAMSISDTIIVMNRGKIVHAGRPADIYHHPASAFVAHFIGESNFVPVVPVSRHLVSLGKETLQVVDDVTGKKDIVCTIRPEKILFEKREENTLEGNIIGINFLGPTTRFSVAVAKTVFIVSTAKHPEMKVGDAVSLYLPPKDILLFDNINDLARELKIL